MTDRSHWFVSTDWLAEHLDDPDVVIVDGSWHLAGRNGREEHVAAHIPGAVFFDIDAIADTSNPLPHMLPSAAVFAAAVGGLGIDEKQKIVVYDSAGLSSAPRVWWTFKVMGAADVVILDGGLPKWIAEGRAVERTPVARPARKFAARFDPASVRDLAQVRDGIAGAAFQLVDARPAARFRGEAPEPRAGLRAGHMPGALNVPYTTLLEDGRLRPREELAAAFVAGGVDTDKAVITSCGSGVTAAILTFALDALGKEQTSVYDGSWTEWGSREDLPVVKG